MKHITYEAYNIEFCTAVSRCYYEIKFASYQSIFILDLSITVFLLHLFCSRTLSYTNKSHNQGSRDQERLHTQQTLVFIGNILRIQVHMLDNLL